MAFQTLKCMHMDMASMEAGSPIDTGHHLGGGQTVLLNGSKIWGSLVRLDLEQRQPLTLRPSQMVVAMNSSSLPLFRAFLQQFNVTPRRRGFRKTFNRFLEVNLGHLGRCVGFAGEASHFPLLDGTCKQWAIT